MVTWIAVSVGAAIGSAARHGVNRLVNHQWPLLQFPAATLIVNIAGCCAIGCLAGLVATERLPMRASWREFVFVGILGGFTTFSAFGLDTITLMRTGHGNEALMNVLLQVTCGLGGVYAGLFLAERLVVVARSRSYVLRIRWDRPKCIYWVTRLV